MQEAREELLKEMKAVLTDDQFKTFQQELEKEGPGRGPGGPGRGPGGPPPGGPGDK